MASSSHESLRLELPQRASSEAPSPLRIIKKHRNTYSVEVSRKSSTQSEGNVEHPIAEGYLTVMKRSKRSHLRKPLPLFNSVSPEPKSKCSLLSPSWQNGKDGVILPIHGLAESQTLNVRRIRQTRPLVNGCGAVGTEICRCPSTNTVPNGRDQIPIPEVLFPSTYPPAGQEDRGEASCLLQTSRLSSGEPTKTEPSPPSSQSGGRHKGKTCVLCPHVTVTAECTTLETQQQSLWAAIEVSGRLSEIIERCPEDHSDVITGSFINPSLDRLFEHGFLYDLTVDILPIPGVTIVQVLREQVFPTTIYAGSGILLLAQIQLNSDSDLSKRRSDNVRQKSDELFDDLEIQLGSSQVPYMQIRITYAHSAFPRYSMSEAVAGVSRTRSRMETTATATLKRHNTSSMWSPRPAPAPNPLFPLIKRHWGAEKAGDAMQQILSQRSTSRKPPNFGSGLPPDMNGISREISTPPAYAPPDVPIRQTSLQSFNTPRPQLDRKGSAEELRGRVTSHSRLSYETEEASSNQGYLSSSSWQAEVPPAERNSSPLRKRRSLGNQGIKSLVPKWSELTMDNRGSRDVGKRASGSMKIKSRRASGKWGWTSWF